MKMLVLRCSTLLVVLLAAGCSRSSGPGAAAAGAAGAAPPVVAIENFLADFTRQVAGDRLVVKSLIPAGVDPHGYEPTPQDVAAVAGARLIVENGAGLESFMEKLLANVGGDRRVVQASHGLASRSAREGEVLEGGAIATGPTAEPDPHFWLDPVMAVRYVQNIRDALSRIDPAGEKSYGAMPMRTSASSASSTDGSQPRLPSSRRSGARWSPTTRASGILRTVMVFGSSAP